MRSIAALTWILAICLSACMARAQVPGPADYRAYRLQYKSASDIEQMLREVLPGLGSTVHLMADSQTNQVLLRGPEEVHQIAKQVIESSDRPNPASPAEQPVVKVYPCQATHMQETADWIRASFANFAVRVAVDPRAPQLLVLAPPSIHPLIARQLASPPSPLVSADAIPRPLPHTRALGVQDPVQTGQILKRAMAGREPRKEEYVPLGNVPLDLLETRLRDLLGTRLEAVGAKETGWPDYLLSDGQGDHVELYLDRTRNGVRISGKVSLTDQLGRLVRGLDSPQMALGQKMKIVPVRRADPAKVREAVEAYRTGGQAVETGRPAAPNQDSRRGGYGNMGIELVAYMLQQPGEADAAGSDQAEANAADERQPTDQLPSLGPEVEYEILPDLDVIILRGREHDVDELTRLIEEIERISAETIPEIDIYLLRHVDSTSISQVVTSVSMELLGGRQGRLIVTPLAKPNALLLIGWGEAVRAVKDLIGKLDQPVGPGTQFRVFTLKHAPVATVGATILQSFTNRGGGLSPVVQVSPDMRLNALVVRAAPRDMAEVELLIQRLDVATPGPVTQARVFKLQNSLAADLAMTIQQAISAAAGGMGTQKAAALELFDVDGQRLIRSGVLDDVQITPDARTNTLVISAPAESIDLVAALIEFLDKPSAVAQIKVFRIRKGDASNMATMLQSLLPSAAGAATQPQLAGAEGESSLVPVRFTVDTRTNSIIATGSEGDLAIIEALLLRLDEEDVQQRINEVYRLRNAPALDVAQSINEFLRSERLLQQATPGVVSPFEQIEREVIVVPEIVSNSLIISATPEFHEEIMDLVKKLDEAPSQVMIQVLIAEVQLNDTEEFGVELGLQDSILFDRSLLADLETISRTVTEAGLPQVTTQEVVAATNTPGFLFNSQPNNASLGNSGSGAALANSNIIGSQGIANFGTGRINSELGFGGLVLSASSDSVSLMLRALKESRRLEVLSRPQIMTLDNQPAFIQVGKRVPRITGSTARAQGLVNEIALENVGLILGVTPRISPEGMVVMELDAEKSDLGPLAEGIPVAVSEGTEIRSPSINVATAQTTVSAASGQTIVIGGLITKQEAAMHRRVPWLSDIPVLGHLFRFDSMTCRRSELLIVLTPHVVKDEEEAERLKRVEAARMHWCLADVNQLHGDTGLVNLQEVSDLTDGNAKTIYPDADPAGIGLEPPADGNWDDVEVVHPPALEGPPAAQPTPAPSSAAPQPTPAPANPAPKPTPAAPPPGQNQPQSADSAVFAPTAPATGETGYAAYTGPAAGPYGAASPAVADNAYPPVPSYNTAQGPSTATPTPPGLPQVPAY
ncbi:MAG: secretin N-terminal domain-containing protein [Thermoguttaceae bacterium]|nr:secretin N-terminal domain-containing protein [Thermoguttaceae bacterium]